jgi:DNA-binding NarL/FixJ family response regulator
MGNLDLSSKIILILANEFNLSHSLKNELQKEVEVVDIASNLHQAVIITILKEPDFIFIEVDPENFSGLQLIETLKKLKGMKKNPRLVIFTEKKWQEYFRQKGKDILFLDAKETSPVSRQIKTILEGPSSLENQTVAPWIQYRERAQPYPAYRKELDILEKLGQLGILKKT